MEIKPQIPWNMGKPYNLGSDNREVASLGRKWRGASVNNTPESLLLTSRALCGKNSDFKKFSILTIVVGAFVLAVATGVALGLGVSLLSVIGIIAIGAIMMIFGAVVMALSAQPAAQSEQKSPSNLETKQTDNHIEKAGHGITASYQLDPPPYKRFDENKVECVHANGNFYLIRGNFPGQVDQRPYEFFYQELYL